MAWRNGGIPAGQYLPAIIPACGENMAAEKAAWPAQ